MKNHIIDFKACLASIPNEDFSLAAKIFTQEMAARNLPNLEAKLKALRFEVSKKSEWKFVVKGLIEPEYVLGIISEAFGASKEDIVGRSRKGSILIARHVYRYVMYNIGWGSLEDVADLTEGNAEHSRHATIINSIKKVEALRIDKKHKTILEFADRLVEEIKTQVDDSIRNGN